MAEQTDVTIIRFLFDLKNHVDEEAFNATLSAVGVSLEEYLKRSKGYENECEFLLGLQLCGLCKQITVLDEKYSSVFGVDTCDALITLNNGTKILVEIKSTQEDKFTITHSHYDKKLEYAKGQGLGLFFAIKINGVWILLNSKTMEEVNLNVKLETCYNRSVLSHIFGCRYYLLRDIKFEAYFRHGPKENKNTIQVKDPDFGTLITDIFYKNDKQVLKIKKNDTDYHFVVVLSEALRDYAKIQLKKEEGDVRVVEYTFDSNLFINSMDIALASIYHMIKDNGSKYTASDYLDHLKMQKETIKNLSPFIAAFADLIKLEPFVLVKKQD